jgi:hypothetical protein
MPPITPRCLAGLSVEALKKIITLLEENKEEDSELKEAVQRLIDLSQDEIKEIGKDEKREE